jgi:glyoxylase-like metal-dependent hydrolase (beta-lactamase superfamily II)
MALVTRRGGGIVLIGDAVMNAPGRGLHLLPNQYIEDRKLARTSLRKLLELNFETVTFAHGHPLTKNAKKRLAAFLK